MSDESGAFFLKAVAQLTGDLEQLGARLENAYKIIAREDARLSVELGANMRSLHKNVDSVKKHGYMLIEQLEQLNALTQTAELITSSLDLTQVLEGVIDTIIRLTKAERGYVMLYEDNDLRIGAARNWDQKTVEPGDVQFSNTIVRMTIEQAQPVLTVNAQDDERFSGQQSVVLHALRSVLCVPLIWRDEVIGVVYADNRLMPGIFADHTVALVMTFANQAAIAIQNARLFQNIQHDLEEAQHDVEAALVQFDQADRDKRVSEITETEYFRRLEALVQKRRNRE